MPPHTSMISTCSSKRVVAPKTHGAAPHTAPAASAPIDCATRQRSNWRGTGCRRDQASTSNARSSTVSNSATSQVSARLASTACHRKATSAAPTSALTASPGAACAKSMRMRSAAAKRASRRPAGGGSERAGAFCTRGVIVSAIADTGDPLAAAFAIAVPTGLASSCAPPCPCRARRTECTGVAHRARHPRGPLVSKAHPPCGANPRSSQMRVASQHAGRTQRQVVAE